ncbi:MAG TPA: T9SS type A sorting domain-containing protein, partial [Candidatus Kapabacteria bacterium]|nr:T9SS type A sorting domain-containing protein [Candidatus Kapabacteria bacterium]
KIAYTTDGGATWNNQASGTSVALYGIYFIDANNGWAVGNNGTILRYTLNPITLAPVLSSPTNNSVNNSINPTLVWQSVENTSSYTLQVSLTNDFSDLVVNEAGIETTTEQIIIDLDYATEYWWRVRAIDENNANGPWSEVWSFTTQPYIPWQVTETNNSSTIIVPTSINPMLGDRPFASGDAIGLFFQNDENEWTCGGYGIWNGTTNLGITVWGDNPDTPIKDGFANRETYTFKVWDNMLGQEWNATATYQAGDNFYTVNGFSFLASLNVDIPAEQNINLNTGWNIISSYIEPENSNITNIFENIVTDVKIVKNGAGQIYDPAFNINNIGNWNFADGYLVNMLNNNELTITGTKLLPETTPINLNNGWNLSAYLRDNEMSPTTALASISPSLVLAKDNVGGIYSPVYGVNTLGNMQAGQGYYFYMNAAAELTYPANSAQKTVAGDEMTPLSKFLVPSMNNTGKNSTLIISIENNEENEIGVYNMNNELIGSGAVHNGIAAITIWGDDEATQTIDGAKDNEYLNVKLYNTSNNTSKEISLTQINEITNNTVLNEIYYRSNSIFVAKASVNEETGFKMSIKNIPNPVENNVVFEFSLTDESNAEIQIYTSTGELVASIGNGNYSAGLHRINFDAGNLTSGVYNIVLSSGSKKVSSFMIVDK